MKSAATSVALPAGSPGTDAMARILTVAETLFARQGFDAVSMNDIAEAAEVSKANVFHHFTSKKDLYLAVVRRACEDASAHLDDLGTDEAPLADRLGAFATAHLQSLLRHEPVTRLILRELLGGNPRAGQDLAEQVYGEKFARFVGILRAGQEAGTLRADIDPAMVATLILGANVFFFESREVLRHFPEATFVRDPADYSRKLTDILLHGILSSHEKTTRNPS
jgi:TetR/AcrR family transcriptional regulator